MEQSAWLAGIPLFLRRNRIDLVRVPVRKIEGWFGDVRRARRFMGGLGCFGSGAGLIVSLQIEEPFWAMVAMGLAAFSTDPGDAALVGRLHGRGRQVCRQPFRDHEYGRATSTGLRAHHDCQSPRGHRWKLADHLLLVGGHLLHGVFCWIFIDPVTPLDASNPKPPGPVDGSQARLPRLLHPPSNREPCCRACERNEFSLYFSPSGVAKCVRGLAGRDASRLARAGVLDSTLSTASKRNRSHGGLIACFDRQVVRNAG